MDDQAGLTAGPGDRFYIPAGGLRIWMKPSGEVGSHASLAVDPWLPDLSMDAATPPAVMETIVRDGFPLSSICTKEHVNACQESRDVRELLAHQEVARLKHMLVLDDKRLLGVLDLDKARGRVPDRTQGQSLFVKDIYEPLSADDLLPGDSSLIDYLLTADTRPFRVVKLDDDKITTVDVEDLQKLPVRIVLFLHFAQLEDALVRRLCAAEPELMRIARDERGVDSAAMGNSGIGPTRKIETYGIGKLLRAANARGIVALAGDEISFLERYRNNVAHGPRWYITRRADVAAFVNCVRRVLDLVREARAEPGG